MARYIYKCIDKACEVLFEVEKKMKDSSKKEKCPKCKGETKKQVSTSTGFSLKGRGWFNTGGY